MVITAYKDAKDYGCRLVLFCINRKFNQCFLHSHYTKSFNYYELKYAFLIGMVLFVKKMGECLVFITILFVTQLAIVVVGAMNDRTGFAKVSHLLISWNHSSFFGFISFFIICWTNWAQMEISFICMSLSYGNLAQKRFLELPIFLICAYPAYVQ